MWRKLALSAAQWLIPATLLREVRQSLTSDPLRNGVDYSVNLKRLPLSAQMDGERAVDDSTVGSRGSGAGGGVEVVEQSQATGYDV